MDGELYRRKADFTRFVILPLMLSTRRGKLLILYFPTSSLFLD